MKICRRCMIEKDASEFRKDIRYRDGLSSWCRQCFRENNSKWAKSNRERLTLKAAAWREDNPETWRETYLRFQKANRERRARDHAAWAKANRGKRNAVSAAYKAAKLRATPPWADRKAIAAIYEEAARIQRETGERMHVDHIVPLQHPLVCGLHCEANLQILPGAINESKKNNWSPQEAQRQGDLFIESAA